MRVVGIPADARTASLLLIANTEQAADRWGGAEDELGSSRCHASHAVQV